MVDAIRRPNRHGLTLVELLVVITIMMLLAAFVLPKFQLNSKTRKIREAARMVSVYLGVARNRAVETGRPCGVMFQPLANQPEGAAVLFQVEEPPLYAGDTITARAQLQYDSATSVLFANILLTDILPSLIQQGDKIQFNGQGPWYPIVSFSNSPDGQYLQLQLAVDATYREHIPWSGTPSSLVAFQIRRQPLATMSPPLELPTGVVVDLAYSGANDSPDYVFNRDNTTDHTSVIVMFSPNGSVSEYYYTDRATGRERKALTDPMFFLVGKESQLGVQATGPQETNEDDFENCRILTNLWVVLNPQTGTVSVTENADTPNWLAGSSSVNKYTIDEARTFAKQARNMGGR